jgi:hypothetical protein
MLVAVDLRNFDWLEFLALKVATQNRTNRTKGFALRVLSMYSKQLS